MTVTGNALNVAQLSGSICGGWHLQQKEVFAGRELTAEGTLSARWSELTTEETLPAGVVLQTTEAGR